MAHETTHTFAPGKGTPMLLAEREGSALALACTVPWPVLGAQAGACQTLVGLQ